MEFDRLGPAFLQQGYHLAAISVDVPSRSRALEAQLALGMPLLCDVTHEVVEAWGLFNPKERGGIALPATVVLDASGVVQWWTREAMSRRARAGTVLAWIEGRGALPRTHFFWPAWAAWRQAMKR